MDVHLMILCSLASGAEYLVVALFEEDGKQDLPFHQLRRDL
jgi:hypothetical protein